MPKKGKLPARRNETEPAAYRCLSFRAAESDESKRSIPVTLATDAGVDVWDYKSRRMIKEHALMGGVRMPHQVVMVDSHNHETVRNIIGSIRNLEVVGGELRGTAFFADKPSGHEAFRDIRDGHLTDISVGFWRRSERYIDDGKEEMIAGQRIKGPARIVTDWEPFEGSAVTVGADRHSTYGSIPAMRAYLAPETFQMEEEEMPAEFRTHLESLGMPKEHSDEQAAEWLKDFNAKREAEKQAEALRQKEKEKEMADKAAEESTRIATEEAAKAERKRASDIRKSVRGAGLADDFADKLVDDGVTVAESAQRILDELAKNSPARRGVAAIESEREKFGAAVVDGIAMRCGWRPAQGESVAPGAQDVRRMRFLDIAKRYADDSGIRSADPRQMVGDLFRSSVGQRASDGGAYLHTGNFSSLLLDATNKTLLKAYMEAESTYSRWVRMAPAVSDFKTIYRARLSEIGYQPQVPEGDEYKEVSLSDNKESYKIEKHGSIVSFTWETMVNDDLGAFSRIVQMQGAAMQRTRNLSVYQLLFNNPTMSDTGAVFNSTALSTAGGHDNLAASDLAVGVLDTAFQKFAVKTGLNSDVLLGLRPRYLIVAPGIYATAWQLFNSVADPAVGGSAAGNSNTANIYGPNGTRSLEIIEEPLLHANDADSWYLACDSNMIDTIEVTPLAGEESPVFEQESAFTSDAVKFKIRQTWGVGVIDWRGLYKSTGA